MEQLLLLSILLLVLNYTAADDVCSPQSASLTPNQGAYHFWSPGFPGPYPTNVNCTWTLASPEGSEINITLWSEFSTDQCCANLTMHEGSSTTGNIIKEELSGDLPAGTNFLVPNLVTVQFQSISNDNSKTGFHAAASAFSLPTTVAPDTTTLGFDFNLAPHCPRQDILFILDSSESVGRNNFQLMKQLAVKITKEFEFGDDNAHFGLITYSRSAFENFRFDTYSTLKAVDDAIQQAFWHDELPRNTASALELGRWFYIPKHGEREDAIRTTIIITNGPHSYDDPSAPARELRERYGVRIISIGIGDVNSTDADDFYGELVSISGDEGLVINVTQWDGLLTQGFGDTMDRMPCSAAITTTMPVTTGLPPSTMTPPVACQQLDIVFVVDSSQSVGADRFRKLMEFLVDFTKEFKVVAHEFTQFALVIFNNRARVEIQLGEFTDVDSLDEGILQTQYTTGNTNTKDALEVVRDNVFQSQYYRPAVPHLVIFITDGVHTNDPPFDVARALRSAPYNATIIAIGIRGVNGELLTDQTELEQITGGPEYVYNELTYDNFMRIIQWTIEHFPCKPKCPADLLFIVETSEIVGNVTVIDKILHSMVPEMASLIGVGTSSSHASLVTFSSPDRMVELGPPDRRIPVSKVQFGFNEGTTFDNINERCGQLTWNEVYGVSDLDLGMELAVKAFNDSSYGGRDWVPKFAIVIASGFHDQASNCCPDPYNNIEALRQVTGNNTYVVAVDTPLHSNTTILNMIAGAQSRVYDMQYYKDVSYEIRETLQTIDCMPPPPV